MIASLRGLVEQVGEDGAIVNVAGVGYLVFCSARTLAALPRVGEAVSLRVETHVREDHIHLYGFATESERTWFRLLTTVQGVGARVALAILSALSPTDIARAIAAGDRTAVSRANGVGSKLAARIVTELKDKAGGIALGPQARAGAKGKGAGAARDPADDLADDGGAGEERLVSDAVSALVNLGYGRTEAYGAVIEVLREIGPDATTGARVEGLIRGGLSRLGAVA